MWRSPIHEEHLSPAVNNWGPGFFPAAFLGNTAQCAQALDNLGIPSGISRETDQATRRFLERMNERHLDQFPGDSEMGCSIYSYQLAARMQLSVPEVTDLASGPRVSWRVWAGRHSECVEGTVCEETVSSLDDLIENGVSLCAIVQWRVFRPVVKESAIGTA